jgi:general secretion pathway protein B
MSFILDALRKSEAERRRQTGTGLVDASHRPPASRRGFWGPLIAIVLIANLVFMGFYWGRDASPPAQAISAPPATPPAAAKSTTPPPVGRPLAAMAGVSSVEDAPYAATADLPAVEETELYSETLTPPATTDAASDTPPPPADSTSVITEGLPTAEQLVGSGALNGPVPHLDIHVFSDDPAERFVFINMRKYTEGMQLPEGPRLEQITPEGAVFSNNGQRYLLARD